MRTKQKRKAKKRPVFKPAAILRGYAFADDAQLIAFKSVKALGDFVMKFATSPPHGACCIEILSVKVDVSRGDVPVVAVEGDV